MSYCVQYIPLSPYNLVVTTEWLAALVGPNVETIWWEGADRANNEAEIS